MSCLATGWCEERNCWWRQKQQDREEQRSKRIRSCSAMAVCWQHHKMWGAAGGFADDHLNNNYGCMAVLHEMILDISDVGIVIHSKRILWHCWNWKWSNERSQFVPCGGGFWLKDVWCRSHGRKKEEALAHFLRRTSDREQKIETYYHAIRASLLACSLSLSSYLEARGKAEWWILSTRTDANA